MRDVKGDLQWNLIELEVPVKFIVLKFCHSNCLCQVKVSLWTIRREL